MLENKVAVVTGSTSGIGLGIARSLASAGADILLNGFGDPSEIEKLRRSMADEFRVRVAYSSADMSDPDQVRAVVELAHSQLSGADILVNNAGIQYTAPVQEFPVARWDAIIAINLSSAFH